MALSSRRTTAAETMGPPSSMMVRLRERTPRRQSYDPFLFQHADSGNWKKLKISSLAGDRRSSSHFQRELCSSTRTQRSHCLAYKSSISLAKSGTITSRLTLSVGVRNPASIVHGSNVRCTARTCAYRGRATRSDVILASTSILLAARYSTPPFHLARLILGTRPPKHGPD